MLQTITVTEVPPPGTVGRSAMEAVVRGLEGYKALLRDGHADHHLVRAIIELFEKGHAVIVMDPDRGIADLKFTEAGNAAAHTFFAAHPPH